MDSYFPRLGQRRGLHFGKRKASALNGALHGWHHRLISSRLSGPHPAKIDDTYFRICANRDIVDKRPEQGIRMNPYYQPPNYDSPRAGNEEETPAPPAEIRRERRGWTFYLGGFFLLLAGVCLVLSNSLAWHPSPTPPRAPPSASGAAK